MDSQVTEAICGLPEPQRKVTTLFYVNGYTVKEIADFLEVPPNTVKSRLRASRERLTERMMHMVKQTFETQPLPDDFAGKIVHGVPVLAWDRTGNTTYIAAVAAAFAATDTPYDYDTLMVYSGLAFRLRYVRRKDGRGWCRVGPVGQFEEEVDAICRATGCTQSWVQSRDRKGTKCGGGDRDEMRRRIVQAVDSGICPTAYIHGDNGVIYGYEDDGNTLFVRCYDLGEGFHRMTLEQMLELPGGGYGPFFMDREREAMSPRAAFTQGLQQGLMNWNRGREPGEKWQSWRPKGVWEYCFGKAAYAAWLEDLRNVGRLTDNEREEFYKCHIWMAYALYDARLAGSRFLAAHAEVLGHAGRKRLEEAAALYDKLGRSIQQLRETGVAFCGGVGDQPSGVSDWTDKARECELEVLTEVGKLDAAAMDQFEQDPTRIS